MRSANALCNLGVCYEDGVGVDKDYKKALEFYQKAPDLEDPNAMFNASVFYEEGKGVEQNYTKAIEYYQKAADIEIVLALVRLAHLYETGQEDMILEILLLVNVHH